MALLGASLIMEILLIVGMLQSPYPAAGGVVLFGRLIHLPASLYLLAAIFSPENYHGTNFFRVFFLPEGERLDLMMGQKHLLDNAKIYGLVASLSFIESSLLQFFPWLASEFSAATFGCPDLFVLRLLSFAKVAQAIISGCAQIAFIASSKGFSKDPAVLTFLGFNIALTLASMAVKAFESMIRSKVVKDMKTCEVEIKMQKARSLQLWLTESCSDLSETQVEAVMDAWRKDGIDTLKSLLECKVQGIFTEDDLKELGKAAKLNKRQILSLVHALQALTRDNLRETVVDPPLTSLASALDGSKNQSRASNIELHATRRIDAGQVENPIVQASRRDSECVDDIPAAT